MWTLRLILIVVGIAFVVAVYWYTRRHPPRRAAARDHARVEPSYAPDGSASAPDSPAPAPSGGGAAARPFPAPAAASTGGSLFALALRLPDEGSPAATVLETLARLDFEPGEQQIYHRLGPDGTPLYSVADLFEPGVLHPLPGETTLRGLVFFFEAPPGPEASRRLDRMLGAARECARRLGGRVEDGSHRPLTAARELELKLAAAGARNAG